MSGPSVPMPYMPTGQGQADQNYQSLLNSQQQYAQALPSQVIPGVQGAVGQIVNNPYAGAYQGAANTAAATGANQVAPQQFAASGSLFGAGNTALGAGNQLLQTGFDPQQALYNQQYQQMLQQQNAINAQTGVGGSPYAAGLDSQAGQNFNMNWINNQLGRESTALSGYDAANAAAGQDYSGGSSLGLAGLNTLLNSGSLPYSTANTIAGNNINAYNQLSQATAAAQAPSDTLMSALAQYLGIGQSATGLAQSGEAQQFAQGQSIMQGLGSVLGDVLGGGTSGNMFGGGLFNVYR